MIPTRKCTGSTGAFLRQPPGFPDERSYPFLCANWLAATIEAIGPGGSQVSYMVTESMLNFHGMAPHGELVFNLGDIAFAAASNAQD